MKITKVTKETLLGNENAMQWFRKHLVDANVLASAIFSDAEFQWYLLENDSDVVAIVFQGLIQPYLPELPPGIPKLFVDAFDDTLTGITGIDSSCTEFAEASSFHPLHMGIPIDGAKATENESMIDTVLTMCKGFEEELKMPGPHKAFPREIVNARLRSGEIQVWLDTFDGIEVPVSLAYAKKNPMGDMFRVSGVYTPPEYRKRGYASAVTFAVSKWCFSNGCSKVVLFADSENPTSNKIYQNLGYENIYRAVFMDFYK